MEVLEKGGKYPGTEILGLLEKTSSSKDCLVSTLGLVLLCALVGMVGQLFPVLFQEGTQIQQLNCLRIAICNVSFGGKAPIQSHPP